MEAGPASEGALQELPYRGLPEAGHRARPLCGALRAGLSGQAGGRDWRDADARPRDVATPAAGNTAPEIPFPALRAAPKLTLCSPYGGIASPHTTGPASDEADLSAEQAAAKAHARTRRAHGVARRAAESQKPPAERQ